MTVHIWTGATDTDFGTAGNWTPSGPPATGDTGIVPASASVNIAGSDETAAPLDKFIVEPGATITIGSASAALQLSFASETNCYAELSGTGLAYINLTEAKEIKVYNAAPSPGTGQYGLNLLGVTTTNNPTIDISIPETATGSPSVSIGANAGEAMECAKITITGGTVGIGRTVTESDGATAPDLDVQGGEVTCYSAMGAVSQTGGTLYHYTGAMTTLAMEGGTCYYISEGTITTLSVFSSAIFDCTRDLNARTVTNATIYDGGTLNDPQKTITFTNGLDVATGGTYDRGKYYTISFSAI